jgi:hypothetical protein
MLKTHCKAWYWGKTLYLIRLKRIVPHTRYVRNCEISFMGGMELLLTQCSIDWVAAKDEVCRSTVASKKAIAIWDIAATHRTNTNCYTTR